MPLGDYPRLERADIHLRQAVEILQKSVGEATPGSAEMAVFDALEKARDARFWIKTAVQIEDEGDG